MSEAVEAVIDRRDPPPRAKIRLGFSAIKRIKRSTCNDSVERVTHAQSVEKAWWPIMGPGALYFSHELAM